MLQKKLFTFLILMFVILISLSSCSKFNRIQKSSDMEAKYKAAIEYYEKKRYYQALQLFEELITVHRGTARAEDTYYYYCQSYYETGDYTIAAYHFNNFAQTFPNSPRAEEALFKNAYCYYLDSPVSSLDQKNTMDAIRQFQLFINRYPESEKVQTSNELIDELRLKLETKDFNNAKLYYRMGKYKAAMVAFQNVMKTYPSSQYKEECLYYTLRSAWIYASQSVEARQPERYKNTIEHYYKLIDAFPEGRYLREAERILEDSQNRLKKLEPVGSVS